MAERFVLHEVFGNEDTDPIPLGIRIGNVVHASRITGVDPVTGVLADGIDAQMAAVHQNVRQVVERAGGSIDNIAQVSFFVAQREYLQAINPPWVQLFPNDDDRPTYKFMVANLPAGVLVQAEMFAVLGARRELIHVPGVAHTNPIPMGVKIGGMVFSSRILPFEPATGKPPEGLAAQAEVVFGNLRTFLTNAGAEPRHISQAHIFIADKAEMPVIQQHWDQLFAGVAHRPVMHAVTYGAGTALQAYIEIVAVL